MILSNALSRYFWTDGMTRYNSLSEAQEPWRVASLVKQRDGVSDSIAMIVDWDIDIMFRDSNGDGVGIVPERFVKELRDQKRRAKGAVKAIGGKKHG